MTTAEKLNELRQEAAILRQDRIELLRQADLTQDCLNAIQRKIQQLTLAG